MAIGLENFPNIDAPDSDYPDGRIKDNPGNGTGTPINRLTNGDIFQFFAKLLRYAGITPNGLPENEYSGLQYIEALFTSVNKNNGKKVYVSDLITDGGGAPTIFLTIPRTPNKMLRAEIRVIGWDSLNPGSNAFSTNEVVAVIDNAGVGAFVGSVDVIDSQTTGIDLTIIYAIVGATLRVSIQNTTGSGYLFRTKCIADVYENE